MTKHKAVVSWSGGKDSYLALHRAAGSFDVQALMTMFTEDGARTRSHGLRPEVIERQAQILGLPLVKGYGSWATYEREFKRVLKEFEDKEISHVIFGDIFLDEHKAWVERVCGECGLKAIEPLWGERTDILFDEFIKTGAEALIVSTRASLLDRTWLGQLLGKPMLATFELLNIDTCGERGEYHTLVISAPRMNSRLQLREIDRLLHDGYWMLDLELDSPSVPRQP